MTLEQRLRTIVIDKAPEKWWGKWFFNWIAEPYIAGHSLEEGIVTAEKEFRAHGRYATLDVLGEAARTPEQAQRYVDAYCALIRTIDKKGMFYASVSLKPSAICAVEEDGYTIKESEETLVQRLIDIVSFAEQKGVKITLDMEDHQWTDRTIKYAKTIWEEGKVNFGTVLQARLKRTETDIQDMFIETTYDIPKETQRVRACIGIYQVPEDMGTNDRYKAKVQLVRRVKELFATGVYVEIATHDPEFVRMIQETIRDQQIPSTRYEFQFLCGVQNAYDIEKALMDDDALVRYYMPVEIKKGDGIPYMQRRLRKNPDIFLHGIRNFLQKYLPLVGKAIAYRI